MAGLSEVVGLSIYQSRRGGSFGELPALSLGEDDADVDVGAAGSRFGFVLVEGGDLVSSDVAGEVATFCDEFLFVGPFDVRVQVGDGDTRPFSGVVDAGVGDFFGAPGVDG